MDGIIKSRWWLGFISTEGLWLFAAGHMIFWQKSIGITLIYLGFSILDSLLKKDDDL